MNESYRSRARISILIAVVFVFLCALSMAVPEFGDALRQEIRCALTNITCVQIVP